MIEQSTAKAPYDVFISYYQKTGKDFALCLKVGLADFELNAFRDLEDIPKTVETDSDEFRSYIDSAIKESPNFVLIMTVGFNKRKEIARELKFAFEHQNKKIILMKQTELAATDLKIEIDGTPIDLSKYQFIPFSNEPELLRKVISALLGKVGQSKESLFLKQSEYILNTEGEGLTKGNPTVEMVVGPTNDNIEWLPPTAENQYLVSCFPYYIRDVQARRTFFEARNESVSRSVFLKVTINGYFHTLVQLIHENENPNDMEERFSFDVVFMEMIQPLLYAIRIMKYREVKSDQTVLFLLKNIAKKRIDFGTWASIRQYSFTDSPVIGGFTYSFNPQDTWKDITAMLLKIYTDLCNEAGCVTIEETIVRQRVREILYNLHELRTTYSYQNVRLPFVDRPLFGLE
jgi:hypothetical protein